jgi:hypothetical protein
LHETYKDIYNKLRNNIVEEAAIPKVGYALDSY